MRLKPNLGYPLVTAITAVVVFVLAVYLLINLFSGSGSTHDDIVHRRTSERSDEAEHVRTVANITRQRIHDQLAPAIRRANILASSPEVIAAMRVCDRGEVTALTNRLIRATTEVDVIAVFDAKGDLCSFNSNDSFGKPFPAEGIDRLFRQKFADRPVVASCLRNVHAAPALEFQQDCDFTPALNNSIGLSVAHSVPVLDPTSGVTLGVVSVRMWFERLLDLLPTDASKTQIVFVSEKGIVFEEPRPAGVAAFPISPAQVVEMLADLKADGTTRGLFSLNQFVIDIATVTEGATIEGGGIFVLAVADSQWITQQARWARTRWGLFATALALLVLATLAVGWLAQQRRMNRDLAVAQEASEVANVAKSSFLAAMSHEIRTPMNGVVGMVDLLMQTSLQSSQMDIAKAIRESAGSLLSIVSEILDFSKIEAGKFEIDMGAVSVAETLAGTCTLLDALVVKKRARLNYFVDPAIPVAVQTDAVRLRQILVNLVSNAVKFSSGLERTGRVSARATLADEEADRVWIEIAIKDNGIGMDDAVKSKLFHAFSQGATGTTRTYGGTGLGLVISQRLAILMGGEIRVESTPDIGSTFTLRLPCHRLPQPTTEPSPIAGLTVLALSKSQDWLDDCTAHLRFEGATVLTDTDPSTSLNADVCVWMLEVEDGYSIEAIRSEIRAHSRAHGDRKTKFLVKTYGLDRALTYRCEEFLQCDGHLTNRAAFIRSIAVLAGRAEPTPRELGSPDVSRLAEDRVRATAVKQDRLILVAEDNEINQDVISRQLTVLGYAFEVVGDGKVALERWKSGDFALLITDLHMPKLDGFELTKAIRLEEAHSARRRTPIVALTANAMKGVHQECEAAGMDQCLCKPVLLVDLKEQLARWIPLASEPVSALPASFAPDGRVDVEILKSQVGDDPERIRGFLRDFCTSAAQIRIKIEGAVHSKQIADAGALAHKLKGSARIIGAVRLGEVCESMERAGRDLDGAKVDATLPALQAELDAVIRTLSA